MGASDGVSCPFCTEPKFGFGVRGDAKVFVYCTLCDAQGPCCNDYDAAKQGWLIAARETK